MGEGRLILGKDELYSMDSYKTGLNNNVMVIGASGAGKTRYYVSPNLLEASGSYIITDPKGNLYEKYHDFLIKQGYEVKKLDFTDPTNSICYNPFSYILNENDVIKLAHIFMGTDKTLHGNDEFWRDASELLIQAIISYMMETEKPSDRTLRKMLEIIDMAEINENNLSACSPLDDVMNLHRKQHKDSHAVRCYDRYRVAADRTLKSILISVYAQLGRFDTKALADMMRKDETDISQIGCRETALFVVVSDSDRSLDDLVNIFFTQAMSELCRFADKHCKGCKLPVPVRFIMDDFATNCKIHDFPRMIASIRSRGISVMLMLQAESQLTHSYGYDGRTIIGNCDTYVYLGGNDLETAKAISERSDQPLKKILNLPIGYHWTFRRGEEPYYGRNIELETIEKDKIGIRSRDYEARGL